jgi:hypothetical protein
VLGSEDKAVGVCSGGQTLLNYIDKLQFLRHIEHGVLQLERLTGGCCLGKQHKCTVW